MVLAKKIIFFLTIVATNVHTVHSAYERDQVDSTLQLLDDSADPDQQDIEDQEALDWHIADLPHEHKTLFFEKFLKKNKAGSKHFEVYKESLARIAHTTNRTDLLLLLLDHSQKNSDYSRKERTENNGMQLQWCNFNWEEGYTMGGWESNIKNPKL